MYGHSRKAQLIQGDRKKFVNARLVQCSYRHVGRGERKLKKKNEKNVENCR
jgi:hypothetical protein